MSPLSDKNWLELERDHFWETGKRDIHATGVGGCTPFLWASLMCPSALVLALLNAGSDLHAVDDTGQNSLHYVVNNNRLDLVEKFLELGSDFMLKDHQGRTPLDIALRDSLSLVQIINLLQEKMAHHQKQMLNETLPQVVSNSHLPRI